VLLSLAGLRPLVLVLEDLQWADPASLRLLEFVAARLHGAPLLLVATYRDDEVGDDDPMAETLGILSRLPGVVRLFPRPFTAAEIGDYVSAVTGAVVSPETIQVIRARTDGNPFFVTELIKLLVSEQSLEDPSSVVTDQVPAGVRDVIRRRLSRLPGGTNAVLSTAAVIGQDFRLETLEAVARLDAGETESALDAAIVAGVVTHGSGPSDGYRFSHALVRDTIYAGLGVRRRARLHAAVGDAIEASPECERRLAELAYQFSAAASVVGPEKGVEYLARAAAAAQGALAYEAAEGHLRSALRLIEDMAPGPERDRRELHLQTLLASSLTVAGGFAASDAGLAWDRAGELCLQIGETREVLMSLAGLAIFFVARGKLEASGALTRHILRLGEALDDVPCLINARFGLGFRAWLLGDLGQASDELEAVSALCGGDLLAFGDVVPWYDPGVIALAVSGLVHWLLGDEVEARQRLALAVEAARRSGHPFKLAMILFYDALLHVLAGDTTGARRRGEEVGDLAAAHGLAELESRAAAVRGWADARDGDVVGGLADLRRSCHGQDALGNKLLQPFLLGCLADAYRRAGRFDDALATLDRALATAGNTGERFYEAELHRARGELLAECWPEKADEASACLRRAVEVAEHQGRSAFSATVAGSRRAAG